MHKSLLGIISLLFQPAHQLTSHYSVPFPLSALPSAAYFKCQRLSLKEVNTCGELLAMGISWLTVENWRVLVIIWLVMRMHGYDLLVNQDILPPAHHRNKLIFCQVFVDLVDPFLDLTSTPQQLPCHFFPRQSGLRVNFQHGGVTKSAFKLTLPDMVMSVDETERDYLAITINHGGIFGLKTLPDLHNAIILNKNISVS
ncbi:Uncharacterized protein HZ326_16477 [Fusarium oxysporum f. sp. albedinis]|nr:Uncharacterized protein HZ326_16477 [Fusarium oxysporum f. sp. albedinis]